jgi:hypothetical protein
MRAETAISGPLTLPLTPYKRRNKLISFRISEELYDLVRIASVQLAGGSISDFAREAIEDAILQRPAATERVVAKHLSTLFDLSMALNESLKSLNALIRAAGKRQPRGRSGQKQPTDQ